MKKHTESQEMCAVTKIFEDGFDKGSRQGEYNALAKLQYLLATATLDDVAAHIDGRVAELTKHWRR